MHNLLRLSLSEFVGLFDTAERYIAEARRFRAGANQFIIFLNGGIKSAASVDHAHLQVVGRDDEQHFAYPETVVARCPADYWQQMHRIHEDLGLATAESECVAWASLVSVKECDTCVISPNIHDGAVFVYKLLQILLQRGTNSFSLAAIPSPFLFSGHCSVDRFRNWPSVLWRLVDRGDIRVRHSDIGSLELFGSAIVATDPWLVASRFRGRPPDD
jgi:hypothetical protein